MRLTESLFYLKRARTTGKLLSALGWGFKTKNLYSPYPLMVKYELTRRCNSNCIMCMRPSLPVYPDVTENQLRRVLSQLPNTINFSPHGYGEPLIHPKFLDFMRIVAKKKFTIRLVTNGLLLDASLCQSFLEECRPDYIRFSLDAGEKSRYEEIRRGCSFDVLVENIKDAVSLRNKLSKKTKIVIGSTLAIHNLDQIEPLIILAKSLKVDSLGFWGLNPHGVGVSSLQNTLRTSKSNAFTELLPVEIQLLANKHNLKIPVDVVVGNYDFTRCNLPYIYTFIQSNGEVFPCTDKLDYPLGNIYKQDFKEIWNGPRMIEFRKNYCASIYPECKLCIFQKRK